MTLAKKTRDEVEQKKTSKSQVYPHKINNSEIVNYLKAAKKRLNGQS